MIDLLRSAGLCAYEDFVRCQDSELVHESNTTTTRRLELPATQRDGRCYLKVYRYADKALPLRLTRSKPLREARNYASLREKCRIDVPDVIAVGSRRRGGILQDGFILTRGIFNAGTLDSFVDLHGDDRPALRCHLITATAGIVARMHAAHFYHIDLQWRNLLVSDDGTDRPRVFVLDCVRGGRRIHPLMRAHGRLRDLSSLHKDARVRLSRTEQVRWLRRYLGVRKLSEIHRAMIRSIVQDRELKDREEPA